MHTDRAHKGTHLPSMSTLRKVRRTRGDSTSSIRTAIVVVVPRRQPNGRSRAESAEAPNAPGRLVARALVTCFSAPWLSRWPLSSHGVVVSDAHTEKRCTERWKPLNRAEARRCIALSGDLPGARYHTARAREATALTAGHVSSLYDRARVCTHIRGSWLGAGMRGRRVHARLEHVDAVPCCCGRQRVEADVAANVEQLRVRGAAGIMRLGCLGEDLQHPLDVSTLKPAARALHCSRDPAVDGARVGAHLPAHGCHARLRPDARRQRIAAAERARRIRHRARC